jgi:hypothetical protein
MAQNWMEVLTPAKLTAWGIPTEEYNEFGTLVFTARDALQKAQSETERTPVVTAQCNAAFKALTDKMRFFKSHYFLVPPLTEADLVSLGIKPADTIRTPIPPPNGQVTADIGYPAAHRIELTNFRSLGAPSTDPRSDDGVNIKIGIVDGTDPYRIDAPPPPDKGELLPFSLSTHRRRERFDLSGNSGKTLCVSLCRKNAKGNPGPFCPVITSIIP